MPYNKKNRRNIARYSRAVSRRKLKLTRKANAFSRPIMSEPRETSNTETAPVAPLMRLGDALGEMRADANAAHDARNSGTLRGPITSLPRLDNAISHALAPGLHGVYGNSGSGKTAFAMQVAANCGFPALYVTCEMAPSELLRRHTARATGTFLDNLKSGGFRTTRPRCSRASSGTSSGFEVDRRDIGAHVGSSPASATRRGAIGGGEQCARRDDGRPAEATQTRRHGAHLWRYCRRDRAQYVKIEGQKKAAPNGEPTPNGA